MPKKMTQEEFIEKANKVHHNKYDYSFVNYVNSTTKIKIFCKKHGMFEQSPDKHLGGNKCRQCAYEERNLPNKLTTEEFIEKAKKIHGDKYDYSLVDYVNSITKVKIICPEHGIFEQIAQNHLAGCECPKCHNNKSTNKKRKVRVRDTKSFIESSKEIHGDKYDYSLVVYKNSNIKVKIKCKKCGSVFEQSSKHHLEKCGCKRCADEEQSKTTEQFIKEAKEIHDDKYDYSLVKYKNTNTRVKIKCKKCGNVFEQKPQDHLKGKRMPKFKM